MISSLAAAFVGSFKDFGAFVGGLAAATFFLYKVGSGYLISGLSVTVTNENSVQNFKRQREEAERNPWIPTVEVIPPTTLYTDCKHPGITINLALPPEIAVEFRNQFEHMWKELMADVRQCGMGSFLELYRKPFGIIGGGPPVKAEYPLNRWGPLFIGSGLICVKNPQLPTVTQYEKGAGQEPQLEEDYHTAEYDRWWIEGDALGERARRASGRYRPTLSSVEFIGLQPDKQVDTQAS